MCRFGDQYAMFSKPRSGDRRANDDRNCVKPATQRLVGNHRPCHRPARWLSPFQNWPSLLKLFLKWYMYSCTGTGTGRYVYEHVPRPLFRRRVGDACDGQYLEESRGTRPDRARAGLSRAPTQQRTRTLLRVAHLGTERERELASPWFRNRFPEPGTLNKKKFRSQSGGRPEPPESSCPRPAAPDRLPCYPLASPLGPGVTTPGATCDDFCDPSPSPIGRCVLEANLLGANAFPFGA